MPVPMRKPLTDVYIQWGSEIKHFTHVPPARIKPVLRLLKDYEERPVLWRELVQNQINLTGGEAAYMLKISRKRASLTQLELAKKLGMPQGNISQLETGTRPIGKKLAKRLGKILNLDYRVFL